MARSEASRGVRPHERNDRKGEAAKGLAWLTSSSRRCGVASAVTECKFKLVPDEEVQTYVSHLGQSLIPAHQRELTDGDSRKLPFRFFVVNDKTANAFALANGTVVVNAGLFAILENEAQLASIVGHEIARATQEHTWRQMQYHKKKRIGLGIAAIVP